MPKSVIETAARALCRLEGHPENISFEGKPMGIALAPKRDHGAVDADPITGRAHVIAGHPRCGDVPTTRH